MDIIYRSASTMWVLVTGGINGPTRSLQFVSPVCALMEMSEFACNYI